MKKRKILVIDDEAIFRKTMAKILGDEFEVFVACSGAEGNVIAQEQKPDLILLDVLMPEMDGIEVLKLLREGKKTKSIPVAMLTNIDKDETISESISLGARGYMIKGNYTMSEIIEKVKTFM